MLHLQHQNKKDMSTTGWIFLTIIIIAICITVHCMFENYIYYKIEQLEQNKETEEDEEE